MLCLVRYLYVISTSVIDCQGRFVPDLTYYVLSGTLNLAHLNSAQIGWCLITSSFRRGNVILHNCRWSNCSTSQWCVSSFCWRTASRYSLCSIHTLVISYRLFSTRSSTIPTSACFKLLSLILTSCKVCKRSSLRCDASIRLFCWFLCVIVL